MDFDAELQRDQQTATANGIRFKVCTQSGRAQPWQAVDGDIASIAEALELARSLEAWKVAVFAEGYHYWSSDYPDLLNTTVLEIPREREPES